MPAIARDQLEALLRHRKLDHTLSTSGGPALPDRLVPTGVPALDARLDGGIPRGHFSEVAGPRSSGRLTIAVSALAAATRRGEAVALIDPLDMFDPASAAAIRRPADAGGRGMAIDFQRMLWIRGEACSSARTSLSCEYGTLQKSLDRAIKALNLVLQAGADGFGLVVLDLAEVAPHAIKRLPYTTWLRLHRSVEGRNTACLVIGSEPVTRSAGGVSVLLTAPSARSLTSDAYCTARVVRARAMETDRDVRLPLSAPAC